MRLLPKPHNLLICFDAFGTLYSPRWPVPRQYNEIATRFGVQRLRDEEIEKRFITAWKEETKFHPYYGKFHGLTTEQWWTNVIHSMFHWLLRKGQAMPPGLAPALLHRFSGKEGYKLHDDVKPLLRKLRSGSVVSEGCRVVIGVITNSDDRALDVMASLGLRVNALRYPPPSQPKKSDDESDTPLPAPPESDILLPEKRESNVDDQSDSPPKADILTRPSPQHDPLAKSPFEIDFVVMSYDLGFEKPDRRIFQAAEAMSQHVVGTEQNEHPWRKVYIGDDFGNDCAGALVSGWHGILVDRGKHPPKPRDPLLGGDWWELLDRVRVIRYKNLAELSADLPTRR